MKVLKSLLILLLLPAAGMFADSNVVQFLKANVTFKNNKALEGYIEWDIKNESSFRKVSGATLLNQKFTNNLRIVKKIYPVLRFAVTTEDQMKVLPGSKINLIEKYGDEIDLTNGLIVLPASAKDFLDRKVVNSYEFRDGMNREFLINTTNLFSAEDLSNMIEFSKYLARTGSLYVIVGKPEGVEYPFLYDDLTFSNESDFHTFMVSDALTASISNTRKFIDGADRFQGSPLLLDELKSVNTNMMLINLLSASFVEYLTDTNLNKLRGSLTEIFKADPVLTNQVGMYFSAKDIGEKDKIEVVGDLYRITYPYVSRNNNKTIISKESTGFYFYDLFKGYGILNITESEE